MAHTHKSLFQTKITINKSIYNHNNNSRKNATPQDTEIILRMILFDDYYINIDIFLGSKILQEDEFHNLMNTHENFHSKKKIGFHDNQDDTRPTPD